MNKPHRKSASVFRITAHVHALTRREKNTTFIENVALTIEQTIVDSNHLLTHANAVGCTLERRESSTFGRSLISPLLCQGNRERARKHQSARVRAASCTHRQWNMLPANVQKQARNRCGESCCPRRVRTREREKCGETTEELRRLVNARAPRRAHPLYFRLRSKLKRRIESRVFYVLNSLRAALQRRLSIQKIKNKTSSRQIVVSKSTPASALNLNAHRLSRKMVNIMFCFFTVFSFCGHVYIPDDERRDERARAAAASKRARLVSSLRKKAPNVKPNKGARRVDSHVARVTMIDFAVRSRARIFPFGRAATRVSTAPRSVHTNAQILARDRNLASNDVSDKTAQVTSRRRARLSPATTPAARASQ